MAAAANLPREAAEKAVVDVARGLGNQGFLGKIVARQNIVTVTATADSCAPVDPATSSSEVPEIQSTTTPLPLPSSSSVAVSSAVVSSVDPIATSSVAASSTFSASRVTPSASTPVSSETPSPPAETNLATRNGGLDEAIIAGVAAFAALAAL
ncbi:conserved hypothetical protein [Histoplasma capsulatum var. duboisii H88]|uniref:Uncharacterized protein n=1 Tax=Ajellomyces capsulatus (strain H88) TaxID=544711 RepID=F0UAV7_AJEC8|nr:conserved hypothetical protein [Histoplasma capsulatum var. duboisii H88]